MKFMKSTEYGSMWIIVISCMSYILSQKSSAAYRLISVPYGDEESYMSGYFKIINSCATDFWGTIQFILKNSWMPSHNMQQIVVSLLSYVLSPEPQSLMLMNYLVFFVAFVIIYNWVVGYTLSVPVSLIISFIPWAYPNFYGFFDGYTGFSYMSIDIMFYCFALATFFQCLKLIKNPESFYYFFTTNLFLLFALLSRQNSSSVLFFIMFFPCFFLLANVFGKYNIIIRTRGRAFAILTVLVITVSCYLHNKAAFQGYYSTLAKSHSIFKISFSAVYESFLDNYLVVDRLIMGKEASYAIPSLLSQVVIIFSLLYAFCINSRGVDRSIKICAISGAFTFYGIAFVLIVLLNTKANICPAHCFMPLLIGLALSSISLLCNIIIKHKIFFQEYNKFGAGIVSAAIIVYMVFFSYKRTPLFAISEPDSPRSVENFALNVDELINDKPIAWLWFGRYNYSIVNYFRNKTNKNEIPFYRGGKLDNILWSPYTYANTRENDTEVAEAIEYFFDHSDFIVMPEYPSAYKYTSLYPYPFHVKHLLIWRYLQTQNRYRFVICKRFKDYFGVDMVLIQKVHNACATCSEESFPKYRVNFEDQNDYYEDAISTPYLKDMFISGSTDKEYIVYFDARFYIIPKEVYVFNFKKDVVLSNKYPSVSLDEAESKPDLFNKIKRYAKLETNQSHVMPNWLLTSSVPTIIGQVGVYKIISYNGFYLAFPGDIEINKIDQKTKDIPGVLYSSNKNDIFNLAISMQR